MKYSKKKIYNRKKINKRKRCYKKRNSKKKIKGGSMLLSKVVNNENNEKDSYLSPIELKLKNKLRIYGYNI